MQRFVYVAYEWRTDDGSDILAVFDNEDAARKFVQQKRESDPYPSDWWGYDYDKVPFYQLAENPPTPTIPDCPENAPNARAPKVTAPTRGPR